MNALDEARRILAAPAAHMILSNPEWRKVVAGLVEIIEQAPCPLPANGNPLADVRGCISRGECGCIYSGFAHPFHERKRQA